MAMWDLLCSTIGWLEAPLKVPAIHSNRDWSRKLCLYHAFSLIGDLDVLYLSSLKKDMQIYTLKKSELYNSFLSSWEFESPFSAILNVLGLVFQDS